MKNDTYIKITEPLDQVFIAEMIFGERSVFSLGLLNEMKTKFEKILQLEKKEYNKIIVIVGEHERNIFNLGGDIEYFLEMVNEKNEEKLWQYGQSCLDLIKMNLNSVNEGVTVISLINGETRGGGVETALASDIIIAQENMKVSFPETILGFFPGMGAFELLTKKIGIIEARKFILEGRVYTTNELYEMGIVNYLCKKENLNRTLFKVIKRERAEQSKFNSIRKIENRINPITSKDLDHSLREWVNCLINISDEKKKLISKVVAKQRKILKQ